MEIIEQKPAIYIKFDELCLLKESVQEYLKISKRESDSWVDDKHYIPEFNDVKITKIYELLTDLKNIINEMVDNGIEEW